MKYGVIGTGALGGYYGSRLANVSKDVHFLLHSDYSFVKEDGLKIDSIHGDFQIKSINAYHQVEDMPKCDVVLVCLKTTNNHLLNIMLPHIIHDNTIVILIQNGLGMEEELQASFPKLQITGGMAFICARKTKSGHIEHLDEGKLNIGTHSKIDKLKLIEVATDFEEAGVTTELVDLTNARWEKLIWNIPFNGLSVVMNATTAELLENRHSQQLIYDIMQEIILAANHCGAHILPKVADKMIEMTKRMTPYSPSMKLDFENKRPLEIFHIYTKPIATALLNGVETPRITMLEKQLRYIESQYIR